MGDAGGETTAAEPWTFRCCSAALLLRCAPLLTVPCPLRPLPLQGNGLANTRAASAATEKEIDDQVQKITQTAYDACYKMLTENRPILDSITDKLIEDETIDYEQLATMRDEHFASGKAWTAVPAAV